MNSWVTTLHNITYSINLLFSQAGPINRELRHLVSSYQSHNSQLKGEISRYRRKLKEAQVEITKVRYTL